MIARLASGLLVALLLGPAPAGARTAWERAVERVVPGVVSLRVAVPRAFDTSRPAYELATGFVVDAERGWILTNRHVVKTGPVVAEAVFQDDEEVPVHAFYRDPVHDFGLFRYDPAHVRFMTPAALALHPELARVGTEVRVIGNDAGEKLSILAGTLARLDREAPDYGRHSYNDFNTFYLQAASSTSGGSSGSPVVDVQGRVVALNAGGSQRASSSFYLPLDRVVRALELLRRAEPVPRGTVHTVFVHRPYDEVRRLGLSQPSEDEARSLFPDGTGMLTVAQIVDGGAADGLLQVGDVLLRGNGEWITAFTPLEALLDDHVGRRVWLEVERAGERRRVALGVADLHAVTPSEYLETGGAVLQLVSYQLARNYSVPLAGIHLASPGYAFGRSGVPPRSVITGIGGEAVASLDELESRLATYPHGARVPLRYFQLEEPLAPRLAVLTVDRRWFPMKRCRRDDARGTWPCVATADRSRPLAREPLAVRFPTDGDEVARRLAPSLVFVEFSVPYRVDGVHGDLFVGSGLVVDAERGLVIVDRETVPVPVGDARLTFAASVSVPGEVVAIHPVHNLAAVAYDPTLIGDTPVRSAGFAASPLRPGDPTWLVGLGEDQALVSRETRVSRLAPVELPLTDPPRFRQRNLELVYLEGEEPSVGGVLADRKGRVAALWSSFFRDGAKQGEEAFFAGIPLGPVAEWAGALRGGAEAEWRTLGAELRPVPLSEARALGLPDAEAARLVGEDHARRLLVVARLTAGSDAERLLEEGDLLLAIGGTLAPGYDDVERAARARRVAVEVLRDGLVRSLEVETEALDARGTDRFLTWAGAVLQDPHPALAVEEGIRPAGVYVAWYPYGSPAHRDGLHATHRIVAADGEATPDLDAFLRAVAGRGDRESVRLQLLDLDGNPDLVAVELDLQYWPTVEFRREADGWGRRELAP